MAVVTSFRQGNKRPNHRQNPTQCHYTFVRGAEGVRFVQLDTFRLDDPDGEGDSTQRMRFDRQGAAQLVAILREAFPNLEEAG